MTTSSHIYIHVPFCKLRCPYCAFSRTTRLSLLDSWFEKMLEDLQSSLEKRNPESQKIKTFYLGGGSPSLLSPEQIRAISQKIMPYLDSNYEWTIELNPQEVDKEYLEKIRSYGVNRLSIGIQSFHKKRLQELNRPSLEKSLELLHAAKKIGFDSISIDLIYGYEDQQFQELKADIERFLTLDLDHLSIYSLQIEPGTPYERAGKKGLSSEREAAYFEYICHRLKKAGFEHYEVSSFARNKKYGKHNLAYWSDKFFEGIGYGAHGYDEFGYYSHQESLKEYLEGYTNLEYEFRDPFNAIMMALRTQWGLDISRWNETYQSDFLKKYREVLEKYRDYLIYQPPYIFLNEKGRELLNEILVDFLD